LNKASKKSKEKIKFFFAFLFFFFVFFEFFFDFVKLFLDLKKIKSNKNTRKSLF